MTDLVTIEEIQILAQQPDDSVLVDEVEIIEVVSVAEQGPRGIQGIPGPAGGAVTFTVGPEALSGHSCVAVNGAGLLVKADSTDPTHQGAVVGLLANAHSPGEQAEVQTSYTLEHAGWAWAPGPIFVGAGGQLVQALPPSAVFSQVVAHTLSATRVLIDPQPPITVA